LEAAGIGLRRLREDLGRRMAFFRLGEVILELVEGEEGSATAFWGLVVVVEDLDGVAKKLAGHLGPAHDAVQPGRRIASLRPSAGVGPALAFMSPPRVSPSTPSG